MGKFSDLPRTLLNDYFEESLSEATTTYATSAEIVNSYLYGGRSSTTVDGGYWNKMWVKIDEVSGEDPPYPGFAEYQFRIDEDIRDNDYFNFTLGSLLTVPASANGTIPDGSEVYFKKGSYIYEWLVKNSTSYENHFNTNKMWLYFGKIYTDKDGYYRIIYDGMKNFVINALPSHQRTDNLTEFMTVCFDIVYHTVYNMTKNINSLIDAREIHTNWIEFLAKNYKIDLDRYFSGLALREWVENLVYLLKRKGTYSSLFIVWKTLLENTLNNLNIYDRWHADLTGETDIPLGHFLDILHQMEYGVEPEGCAGSFWYQRSFTLADTVYHIQNDALTTWDIYHQMFSRNIIVQCYNHNRERIWPASIVAINTGLVRITFGTPVYGYAYLIRRGDYLHTQGSSSDSWNISHMLGQQHVLNQYQTELFSTSMPNAATLLNENVIEADFPETSMGYAMVKADGVYKFNQGTADTTWTINHGIGHNVFVQVFDNNNEMIQPLSLTLSETGGGTAILSFSEAEDGYILVKLAANSTTLPDYELDDMILSTHYKVEVDLSCEPLDDSDDDPYILSETTIDRLMTNWELMRPVTRFSHYHLLIAPVTDFSGNDISLYGYGYNASLYTKYVTSAGEMLPESDTDTMIHTQYVNSSVWTITHTLSATDWIVQCYDSENYRIWPNVIHPLGTNRVEIIFNDAINGHAVLLEVTPPSGVAYTQSIAATGWDVTHEMDTKEAIIQLDNILDHSKIMPLNVILEDVNDIKVEWSNVISGYSLLSGFDTIYTKATSASTWTVNHNLGTDSVVCQFFDSNDKMIEPDSVYLDNRNKLTATFGEAVAGYAVLRGVNKTVTEQEVINSIIGGTWIIGEGPSGSIYDPLITKNVRTLLASGSDLDVESDDDYYYITFDVDNVINSGEDWNITEALILNNEGDPKFYSYFSPIHKPSNVWFNMHIRVKRSQT